MGSRGQSSRRQGFSSLNGGGVSGIEVTTQSGEKTTYYFEQGSYRNSISGDPQEIPAGLKPSEFANRIKQNGNEVKIINKKQISKRQKQAKDLRKEMEKDLDKLWYRGAPRPRHGWKGH